MLIVRRNDTEKNVLVRYFDLKFLYLKRFTIVGYGVHSHQTVRFDHYHLSGWAGRFPAGPVSAKLTNHRVDDKAPFFANSEFLCRSGRVKRYVSPSDAKSTLQKTNALADLKPGNPM